MEKGKEEEEEEEEEDKEAPGRSSRRLLALPTPSRTGQTSSVPYAVTWPRHPCAAAATNAPRMLSFVLAACTVRWLLRHSARCQVRTHVLNLKHCGLWRGLVAAATIAVVWTTVLEVQPQYMLPLMLLQRRRRANAAARSGM